MDRVLQLDDMVALVRGNLPKLARKSIGALAVIDVHARDVVTNMVKRSAPAVESAHHSKAVQHSVPRLTLSSVDMSSSSSCACSWIDVLLRALCKGRASKSPKRRMGPHLTLIDVGCVVPYRGVKQTNHFDWISQLRYYWEGDVHGEGRGSDLSHVRDLGQCESFELLAAFFRFGAPTPHVLLHEAEIHTRRAAPWLRC